MFLRNNITLEEGVKNKYFTGEMVKKKKFSIMLSETVTLNER